MGSIQSEYEFSEYLNAQHEARQCTFAARRYRHQAALLRPDYLGKLGAAIIWTAIACAFAFLAGAA